MFKFIGRLFINQPPVVLTPLEKLEKAMPDLKLLNDNLMQPGHLQHPEYIQRSSLGVPRFKYSNDPNNWEVINSERGLFSGKGIYGTYGFNIDALDGQQVGQEGFGSNNDYNVSERMRGMVEFAKLCLANETTEDVKSAFLNADPQDNQDANLMVLSNVLEFAVYALSKSEEIAEYCNSEGGSKATAHIHPASPEKVRAYYQFLCRAFASVLAACPEIEQVVYSLDMFKDACSGCDQQLLHETFSMAVARYPDLFKQLGKPVSAAVAIPPAPVEVTISNDSALAGTRESIFAVAQPPAVRASVLNAANR